MDSKEQPRKRRVRKEYRPRKPLSYYVNQFEYAESRVKHWKQKREKAFKKVKSIMREVAQ